MSDKYQKLFQELNIKYIFADFLKTNIVNINRVNKIIKDDSIMETWRLLINYPKDKMTIKYVRLLEESEIKKAFKHILKDCKNRRNKMVQEDENLNTWRILINYPRKTMSYKNKKFLQDFECKRRNISNWIYFAEDLKKI
jgi:hypothetical protein